MNPSPKNRNKEQIFEKEEQIFHEVQRLLADDAQKMEKEQILSELRKMTESYKTLLGEARLLTSVSDRLQSKLNKANETVLKKNEDLEVSILELTASKVRRQATNVVLLLTIFIFIISEGMIDANMMDIKTEWFNPWFFIMMVKVLIVVMILPVQRWIENILLKGEKDNKTAK